MKLNGYERIDSYELKQFTAKAWINEVISGEKFGKSVELIREVLEETGKNDTYQKLKVKHLPVVKWNFNCTGKKDSNITSPTGLVYVDIDTPDYDPGELDMTNIYALYRSIGGKGWVIIVRADGITKQSFKEQYSYLVDYLGLTGKIDKNGFTASINNYMSYDPDAYFNPDATPLDLGGIKCTQYNTTPYSNPYIYHTFDTSIFDEKTKAPYFKILTTNALEYLPQGEDEATFIDKKQETLKIFFPRKINTGKRKITISTIFGQMLLINPNVPAVNAFKWLSGVNNTFCTNPLSKEELIDIFKSNWSNRIYKSKAAIKERLIILNPKLDISDKKSRVMKAVHKQRLAKTEEKIYLCLQELGDQSSCSQVSKYTGLGIATVKRHLKNVKQKLYENREKEVNSNSELLKNQTQQNLERDKCGTTPGYNGPLQYVYNGKRTICDQGQQEMPRFESDRPSLFISKLGVDKSEVGV